MISNTITFSDRCSSCSSILCCKIEITTFCCLNICTSSIILYRNFRNTCFYGEFCFIKFKAAIIIFCLCKIRSISCVTTNSNICRFNITFTKGNSWCKFRCKWNNIFCFCFIKSNCTLSNRSSWSWCCYRTFFNSSSWSI